MRTVIPSRPEGVKAESRAQPTGFTAGGFQVPLRIDGSASLGQYSLSIRTNRPGGAGSQLDSLSGPGESFWM